MLYLESLKRVEAPGHEPYPPTEAITRTLHLLQLTLPGEAPQPTAPQPTESAGDLITRGRALQAQGRDTEALPLFQRAIDLDPRSFDAWYSYAYILHDLEHYEEALAA